MKIRPFIILAFLLLTGCARIVIYENNEPHTKAHKMYSYDGRFNVRIEFRKYKIMREGKEVLEWPVGLELERKRAFLNKPAKLDYHVKISNGYRDFYRLMFVQVKEGVRRDTMVYKGRLPYREYSFQLPTNEGQFTYWLEFYNKHELLTLLTPRAIYQIKSKERNQK